MGKDVFNLGLDQGGVVSPESAQKDGPPCPNPPSFILLVLVDEASRAETESLSSRCFPGMPLGAEIRGIHGRSANKSEAKNRFHTKRWDELCFWVGIRLSGGLPW